MMKLILALTMAAGMFAVAGCETVQYTDEDGKPIKRVILSDKAEAAAKTAQEVAEGVGPWLPTPWNYIATLVAGLAGGIGAWNSKISSYNAAMKKATMITVPRNSIPGLSNQPM
jgi:hypothetical protein